MVDGDGIESYKVVISRKELDKLRRWGEWATTAGVLDEFLVAIKTVNFRLSFEPLDWGEPRYSLKHLKLAMRFGTFRMLNVWYGVNARKRIVFVKLFQYRGDDPQRPPPDEA